MHNHRAVSLLTLVVCLCPLLPVRAAERPNVLFLFADDQRADTIGALGNDVIRTPHLDDLVRESFHFDRAYCMGAMQGAVCVPSRAMVNSGRSLFHINDKLAGITTLGELLGNNGYSTFGTGKWHNQQESLLRSFQQGRSIFLGGMSDHTQVKLVDIAEGKTSNAHVGDKFSSTLFADAAVDFLQTYNGDQPFYVYVAFTAPHDPRQVPEGDAWTYDPQQIRPPENFLPQHPFFNGWMTGRDETLAPWPRTQTIIRHQLAEYYGMISHLDAQVGRILQALAESGQADNTIVVYSADHGLALGSHGLLGKQSVYEHSMRVPLVFHGKGIPAGGSSDALVYLFDIFPTICELTGIAPPQGVDGHSLAPIWGGEQKKVRDSLFLAYEKFMRSVRDDHWKLIRYAHINKTQLFDLEHDPYELHDLSGDHRQASRMAEMFAVMEDWQQRLGDDLPLTSNAPESADIDLTGRERTADEHQPGWIVRKYFDLEGWNWRDE